MYVPIVYVLGVYVPGVQVPIKLQGPTQELVMSNVTCYVDVTQPWILVQPAPSRARLLWAGGAWQHHQLDRYPFDVLWDWLVVHLSLCFATLHWSANIKHAA